MIVVADTSVIVNLVLVGQGRLLAQLFGEVIIPPAVNAAFLRLAGSGGRFSGISLPAEVHVRRPATIPEPLLRNDDLDAGE
jgi:predicted nucleic acid-binding protein